MDDAVAADAARMSGRDFADARGAGLARRVRTRRTVRAAGIGGTSALAVGVLVVGALNMPWGATDTNPFATGTSGCVEAPWPRVGPDGAILSGSDTDLSVELNADGLTLTEFGADPASEVTVPVSDGLLQGTIGQDETLVLTMPSGRDVAVSLRWTDTEIAVSFGKSADNMASMSTQRYRSDGPEVFASRYHGIDASSAYPSPTWYLWDDYVNVAALTVSLDNDETVVVTLPDGSKQTFPIGADRVAGFEWQGVGAFEVDFTSSPMLVSEFSVGAETDPLDATLAGPQFCVPDSRVASIESATPTSVPDPGFDTKPEDITGSPFECGFVFDTESFDAPHLTITATAWNTPKSGAAIGDNSGDTQWTNGTIDTSDNAAHGVVKTSLAGASSGGGVVGGRDPGSPAVRAEYNDFKNGTYTGVSFVSVRDGVVVGTLLQDFTSGDAQFAVTGMDGNQSAASLTHAESAFVACPGEQPSDGSVDVYFVASAVTLKGGESNPVAGPEYAWSHITSFTG